MQTGCCKLGRATPRQIAETSKLAEDSKKNKNKRATHRSASNYDTYIADLKFQKAVEQKAVKEQEDVKITAENSNTSTSLNKLV